MTISERIRILREKKAETRQPLPLPIVCFPEEIPQLRHARDVAARKRIQCVLTEELLPYFEITPREESLGMIMEIEARGLLQTRTRDLQIQRLRAQICVALTFPDDSITESYVEIVFEEIIPWAYAPHRVVGKGETAWLALEDFRENIARWIVEQL